MTLDCVKFRHMFQFVSITRTKTSIRYAKENDIEKRERRRDREKRVEGEI